MSYLRKLMRQKFWSGPGTGTKWRVLKRERHGDDLHLLGRSGNDYCVFSFYLPKLSPQSVPSDKFTSGAKSGEALFREICDRHEHTFAMSGRRGGGAAGKTFICERCACGVTRERPATKEECRKISDDWKRNERRQKLMHVAWRPVQKVLKDFGSPTDQETKGKLSAKLERLMEKYPDYIRYSNVDDDYHTGSDIFFVSHKYDDKVLGTGYWGTTVIYIAQCSPDPPVSFFCYPGHMSTLRKNVETLDSEARKMNRGKNRWEI